ncbi:MAG: hypothetical protein KTR31_27425 [Myxococcales bacterium]|nr:hypothetical protein [Myxococcales bacterium]
MTDSRISKLELDRFATGELSEEEAADVRARLDDKAREHLVALEEARAKVPALDIVALRARAARLPDDQGEHAAPPQQVATPPALRPSSLAPPSEEPAVANRPWWVVPATLLAMAAAVMLTVLGIRTIDGDPGPDTLYRTGDALTLHQAANGLLQPEPYRTGSPLLPGDVLGFRVNATDRLGVVLLSVDGSGRVSVFYPASGNAPLPLSGEGFVPIGGTVRLDATAGREVFVARFDTDVSESIEEVERTFSAGGYDALIRWAEETSGADAVEITRANP